MKRSLLITLVGALGFLTGAAAFAAPAQVIFLRHGEKPETGPELNERGRERAAALVKLFTTDPRALEHGPAAAIYAMRPHGKNGSVRAIQTMEPAGRALGVTVNTRFTRDEFAPLAQALLTDPRANGKTVIVCWEHDAIPQILAALGWTAGPQDWPGKSYDRLWVLDFEKGKPVQFRDLPQKLLPGDKAK